MLLFQGSIWQETYIQNRLFSSLLLYIYKKHISNFKQQCKCMYVARHQEQSMTGLNEIKLFLYLWSVFVCRIKCWTANKMFSVIGWKSPVNTQTSLCENRNNKINHFIHFNAGAFLTFYRVTDSSSSTQKETGATVTSRAKRKTRHHFGVGYS